MDYYARVRNGFVTSLQANLEGLGVQVRNGGGADHVAAKCPFCDDKGGSASIDVHSAFLKCFQCGVAEPLFDWAKRRLEVDSPWAACKILGERLAIPLPIRGKRGAPPADLNEAELELLSTALWDNPEAQIFRNELEKRGFKQAEIEKYCLGFRGGHLIFPAIEPDGRVRGRAHVWLGPWVEGTKWRWSGKAAGSTNYLWPLHLPPRSADATIYLAEGEWDCMILREKYGVDAYTWSGGAGTPLVRVSLPPWMGRKKVVVIYDNDVWQGPMEKWAPDPKKEKEMESRQRNLLHGVCGLLHRDLQCEVSIGLVPIRANDQWGADVRDAWSTGKAPTIEAFALTSYTQLTTRVKQYTPIKIGEPGLTPQADVTFTGRVATLSDSQLWFPDFTTVQCPRGMFSFCSKCALPGAYPEGVIDWTQLRELQAQMFTSRNPTESILKHVIGKPTGCSQAELIHSNSGKNFHAWSSVDEANPMNSTELGVLSETLPETSSDMIVEGTSFLPKDGMLNHFVLADTCRPVARIPFLVHSFMDELHEICPHDSPHLDDVKGYFERRYRDLAANVTKIFGASDLHLAFDLVMHTALWLNVDGRKVRGWGDAAMIGVTRSGKSQTVRSLHEHYGSHGEIVSTQGAFSIAGLVSSQVKSKLGQWRSKPGLIPRNHARAVVLDEFHMMKDTHTAATPLIFLQEARDQGVVYVAKASSAKFNAAVRLMTIANAVGEAGFLSFSYPCEQLLELYGKPEAISRLDFLVVVTDEQALMAQETIAYAEQQKFTARLCAALMRRAWDLPPDAIAIEPEAIDHAAETVKIWTGLYSPELPLHTGIDKIRSILRMAVSTANLCFSHPSDNAMACLVRKCHVEFAVEAMERFFVDSGYGEYSMRAPDKKPLAHVFRVEWLLMRNLPDPAFAPAILKNLLSEFSQIDLGLYLGLDQRQCTDWHFQMFAAGALDRRRVSSHWMQLRLTRQANMLARRLIQMAEDDADQYVQRRRALEIWSNSLAANPAAQPNLDEILMLP